MRRNPENCHGRIIIDDARVVEKKGENGEKLEFSISEQNTSDWQVIFSFEYFLISYQAYLLPSSCVPVQGVHTS